MNSNMLVAFDMLKGQALLISVPCILEPKDSGTGNTGTHADGMPETERHMACDI